VAGKKSISGSWHAGPTSRRSRVQRPGQGAVVGKAGSPPVGSSRESLAGSASRHRRTARPGMLPAPEGSPSRRIGLPSGHHRAGGVDPAAQWNPLPIGDWRPAGSEPRPTYGSGPSAGRPGRIGRVALAPAAAPKNGSRGGRWVILGGLVAAALASAAGVAIMAAAAPGTPIPDPAPVSTTSVTTGVVDDDVASTTPVVDPGQSSALRIPAPTAPTSVGATSPVSPAAPAAPTPGPATVSELIPGDPGFGWPSSAFGSETRIP